MRITKILIILFTCFLSVSKAQMNKDIQRADAFFHIGQYRNSQRYYELGKRKSNINYVYQRLAECHRKLGRPELSVKYLLILKQKGAISTSQRFELAKMLKMVGKYNYAKAELLSLAKTASDQSELYAQVAASCDSAQLWRKAKSDWKLHKLTSLNSTFSDISPSFHHNNLLFASNREDFIIKNKPGGQELPFFDLYTSELDENSNPGKPSPFAGAINTSGNESSIAFSPKGDKVFFTQHTHNSGTSVEDFARMKIFYYEKIGERWKNPHTFIFNDSTSSFAHPFVSSDEKLFFFISDMKGGLGGTDIYFCIKKDSLWSLPINMGAPVNTPGNETYPFYNPNQKTLYFASDYHIGMGGFDMFKAVENNGEFTVSNMKYPFNSSYDDFGLFWVDDSSEEGYFVSNRPGGLGLEDIYKVNLRK